MLLPIERGSYLLHGSFSHTITVVVVIVVIIITIIRAILMTNHNITTNHSRKNNIPILTIIFLNHNQIDFSLVYCLTIIYINYTPLMLHLRSRKM